ELLKQSDCTIKLLNRFLVPAQFRQEQSVVVEARWKLWIDRQRGLEKPFRFRDFSIFRTDDAEHVKGIEITRIGGNDAAVKILCFLQLTVFLRRQGSFKQLHVAREDF